MKCYRPPLRWPDWLSSEHHAPNYIGWGGLVTIAGTPNSGKARTAAAVAQQVLERGGAVVWVSARQTSDPEQLFPNHRKGLHWIEGPQASQPILAEAVLRSPGFDLVVIDSLDSFYRTQPEEGQTLLPHPALTINKIVLAAEWAKVFGRISIVINHLWDGPKGIWMPGREILIKKSSQLCYLHRAKQPVIRQKPEAKVLTPLAGAVTEKMWQGIPRYFDMQSLIETGCDCLA